MLGHKFGGKRLELFKDIVPNLRRVALLYNARGENPIHAERLAIVREIAPTLKVALDEYPEKSRSDIDEMLLLLTKANSDGIFVICSWSLHRVLS